MHCDDDDDDDGIASIVLRKLTFSNGCIILVMSKPELLSKL